MERHAMGRNGKADIPWYRSIMSKQMLAFLLVLLPIACLFYLLYGMIQKNTLDNMSQIILSNDTAIFENFENSLDHIQLLQINLIGKGDAQVLSMLWNVETEETRIQRMRDIQKWLVWMSESNELSADYKLYLYDAGIMLSSKLVRPLTASEMDRAARLKGTASSVFREDSQLVIYSIPLSERAPEAAVSLLCETPISNFEIRRLLWGRLSNAAESKILYANGAPFLASRLDTKALPEEIESFYAGARAGNMAVVSDTIRIGEESFYCTLLWSERHDLALLSVHPYEMIRSGSDKVIFLVPICVAIFLLVSVGFLLYFNSFIKRPIIILTNAFKDLVSGQAREIQTRPAGDEFKRLYEGFNEMNYLLKKKNEQMYFQGIEMEKSKLKQLQAQINPHFLFNSLFIVKAKLWNRDYDGASRLVELLGEYFQFLNRDAKDFVPLETELSHARVYANIQLMRFSDRLTIDWEECPPEYQNITVPRLMIQPLVENSIKYDLENLEENGLLRLHFSREEGLLIVIIESSGTGIDVTKIHKMNDLLDADYKDIEVTSTINIHRRLKLLYGNAYGLRFSHSELGGLRIALSIAC